MSRWTHTLALLWIALGITSCAPRPVAVNREPEVAVACCQALGQIEDSSAIEPLRQVLGRKSFLSRRPRWDGQVRATAVIALRQFEHPDAENLLQQLANDRDPIIRQLSQSGSSK